MAQSTSDVTPLDYTRYDFKNPETYRLRIAKGLSREVVEQISDFKKEPEWMREYRLRAYDHFVERPMPDWGPSLAEIDFDSYTYRCTSSDRRGRNVDRPSSPSPSGGRIRTTSPPSSTPTRSQSGRATTAPSLSWSGSASRRSPGRARISTTPRRRSIGS